MYLIALNILPRTCRLNGSFSFVSVSSWYETWHSYWPESLRLGFTIYKVSYVSIGTRTINSYLQSPVVAVSSMDSCEPLVLRISTQRHVTGMWLDINHLTELIQWSISSGPGISATSPDHVISWEDKSFLFQTIPSSEKFYRPNLRLIEYFPLLDLSKGRDIFWHWPACPRGCWRRSRSRPSDPPSSPGSCWSRPRSWAGSSCCWRSRPESDSLFLKWQSLFWLSFIGYSTTALISPNAFIGII